MVHQTNPRTRAAALRARHRVMHPLLERLEPRCLFNTYLVTNANDSGIAELVGEPYSTIDYWSKMGLLLYERKGNKRLYVAPEAQARCDRIRQRQNSGLNLAAIKEELGKEQS